MWLIPNGWDVAFRRQNQIAQVKVCHEELMDSGF